MKPADRNRLLALADEWWRAEHPKPLSDVYSGMAKCADELRALVAELETNNANS